MRMVEERGKGGLYTPRSLIRKLKVYTRIDKKRNYKTRRRFFCEATTPRAGEIFLPVNKLIFSTQPILSGIEALGRPRNTNIRRGIDSLAPARFGLTARPSMSLGSRRLHSRCGATFSQIAERVTNIDIHRGIHAEGRTGRSRFQFPGTRRFCLRNCGSRFFRCRDKGRNQD